ncbi:hypothetical protein J1605_002692 [Eschrichtius robustus]|uniref:Tetraspanin n=1 Tax=Eschrichtius robustus TaxID=9764 RepID=A0AB34HY68_ESCRO|nr:hypothetical protein J1605_002692 [Eschrichtius robustus]
MGSACIKVTKYFLFLFNLLFFVLGAVILGFGVWILADRSSFISVLQTSSTSLKAGAYVFIGVGGFTMLMGFLGCIGAVNEVRCLLGMYFAFLLLILIAQVTAGVLFYFNMGKLKQEMGSIVTKLIQNYTDGHEDSLQEAWDYVQAQQFLAQGPRTLEAAPGLTVLPTWPEAGVALDPLLSSRTGACWQLPLEVKKLGARAEMLTQVQCCGWVSFYNWTENAELMNRINITYPCSCKNKSKEDDSSLLPQTGFCEAPVGNGTQSSNNPDDWPVYKEGCMEKVQAWLQENLGIILGVCVGIAVIELLGMLLSIFLCRHVHSEDYSKVPKY